MKAVREGRRIGNISQHGPVIAYHRRHSSSLKKCGVLVVIILHRDMWQFPNHFLATHWPGYFRNSYLPLQARRHTSRKYSYYISSLRETFINFIITYLSTSSLLQHIVISVLQDFFSHSRFSLDEPDHYCFDCQTRGQYGEKWQTTKVTKPEFWYHRWLFRFGGMYSCYFCRIEYS